jgi:hypothetical protein
VDQRPGVNNTSGSDLYPAVGGKLEYRLQNNARLSGEYSQDTNGVDETRVMLQRSSRFENYNPQRRRWDLDAGAQAGPAPRPSPTPTPTPGPQGRPAGLTAPAESP